MLIVDPLLSNSTFPPMPVSDDPPDAIINPPAMSEPDVERPHQRLHPRPRRRPTYAYVPPMTTASASASASDLVVVPLVHILAVM